MCHLSKDLAPPTLQNGGLSHERPKPRWCTLWPPRLSVHHGKVAHLARTCTSGDATPVLALWRGRTTRQPRASEEKPPSWCSGGGRCGRTVLVSANRRPGSGGTRGDRRGRWQAVAGFASHRLYGTVSAPLTLRVQRPTAATQGGEWRAELHESQVISRLAPAP